MQLHRNPNSNNNTVVTVRPVKILKLRLIVDQGWLGWIYILFPTVVF